ncbi:hypothetical protein V494_06691 [Pseudogymnoascus sp. VKM F-4513 (FW-928)]|nr:hypothetical protein V494_06691 [Pseudogymnoascus sp. VKM F-4513 (FW-928)]
MLPIQPRRGRQRNKELAAIRIGARVGHTQDASTRVLELGGYLVGELLAVDGGAAAAGAGWVAGLDHEGGDDTVDEQVVVVAALGEGGEVSARLGRG